MEDMALILVLAAVATIAVTGVALTLFLRWAKRDDAQRNRTKL